MVSFSPVTNSAVNVNQSREQPAVREDASRERLSSTQAFKLNVAKTETENQKNYRQQQDFANARLPDPSTTPGNRRGSLLDLTV